MDREVILQVVIPVMSVKGTAFIGLSTLGGPENLFNKMLDMVHPDGRKIFKTMVVNLVCDRCRRRGVADACQHNRHVIPPWQSQANRAVAQMIMEQAGRAELAQQELRNIPSRRDVTRMFSADVLRERLDAATAAAMARGALADVPVTDSIQVLLDAPRRRERLLRSCGHETYSYFVTTVDPSVGGAMSQYSIVSMVFIDRAIIVRPPGGAAPCTAARARPPGPRACGACAAEPCRRTDRAAP